MMQFDELPKRIFLDSSVLQYLGKYGEFIWDEGDITKDARILRIRNGIKNLEALQNIVFVHQRAFFEFALSKNSLKEVAAKKDSHYLQWTYEMLDHWNEIVGEYENSDAFSGKGKSLLQKLDKKKFDYLSKKDKKLIFDAILLECDTFLTAEEKLPRNSAHIKRELNITILRPFEYWELLKPWAALWV